MMVDGWGGTWMGKHVVLTGVMWNAKDCDVMNNDYREYVLHDQTQQGVR